MIMARLLPETIFPGAVYSKTSVSVREQDGLLHHGNLIGREKDDMIVDFHYGKEGVKVVPIGKIYKLMKQPSFAESFRTFKCFENYPVEILLRLQKNEPWKWYSATFTDGNFEFGSHALVRTTAVDSLPMVLAVPGRQVRIPQDNTALKRALIRDGAVCVFNLHRPMPWDPVPPNVNKLIPQELLNEVLDCLDSAQRTKARLVCSLWNDIATEGSVVLRLDWGRLFGRKVFYAPKQWNKFTECSTYLCRLWNNNTRVIVLTGLNVRFAAISAVIEQIISNSCYPPLKAVVLDGDSYFAPSFIRLDAFNKSVSAVQESLRTVCRSVVFHNTVVKVGDCRSLSSFGGFEFRIPEGRIDLRSGSLAVNLWALVDDTEIAQLRVRFHVNFVSVDAQRDAGQNTIKYILWILNELQRLDPNGAPEYRGKEWLTEDLVTLDVEKLTRLSLFAAVYRMYR